MMYNLKNLSPDINNFLTLSLTDPFKNNFGIGLPLWVPPFGSHIFTYPIHHPKDIPAPLMSFCKTLLYGTMNTQLSIKLFFILQNRYKNEL